MSSRSTLPGGTRREDARPPRTGPEERDVLLGFLDYLRASVAAKVDGAPEPDARTAGVPSGTNLLGLVKHLTHVERWIFLNEDVTDWPATFHPADDESAEDLVAAYRGVVERANEAVAASADLREPVGGLPARQDAPTLRWALVHMIEETARHAGHADILRELVDGTTGR